MKRKRRVDRFNGWDENDDKSNLQFVKKIVKKLENEIEKDVSILEEFKSFIDTFVEASLQMKIQACINNLPSFTTDLEKAAEFITEFMCDFDYIDSSDRCLSIDENFSEKYDCENSYHGEEELNPSEGNFRLTVGHEKNIFKPVGELKVTNVDLCLQPVISLTRLNISDLTKSGKTNNSNPEKNKRKLCDDDYSSFLDESDKDSIPDCCSEYLNHTKEIENQYSDGEGSGQDSRSSSIENDNTPNGYVSQIHKSLDTFMDVMRKTTEDSLIRSALKRNFKCNHCPKRFLKKETLRKHIFGCELKDNRIKPRKKHKKDRNYACNMCGISYLNKYSLEKHNANVHNLRKLFKCLVCRQSFYNEEALVLHCRSRHGLGGSNTYKCPYCDATFNVRGDLNYHCRKYHNSSKYYICPKCLECFKTEDMCKIHEQSHGYSCDICMFTTNKESEIIAHRSKHLHVIVYKCDKCLRTFRAKQYFTRHIKIHEREKKI